jgi:hypothetical protein
MKNNYKIITKISSGVIILSLVCNTISAGRFMVSGFLSALKGSYQNICQVPPHNSNLMPRNSICPFIIDAPIASLSHRPNQPAPNYWDNIICSNTGDVTTKTMANRCVDVTEKGPDVTEKEPKVLGEEKTESTHKSYLQGHIPECLAGVAACVAGITITRGPAVGCLRRAVQRVDASVTTYASNLTMRVIGDLGGRCRRGLGQGCERAQDSCLAGLSRVCQIGANVAVIGGTAAAGAAFVAHAPVVGPVVGVVWGVLAVAGTVSGGLPVITAADNAVSGLATAPNAI